MRQGIVTILKSSRMMRRTYSILSPAVKRLVQEHDIDPNLLVATGPKNNILKGDVLTWLSKDSKGSEKGYLDGNACTTIMIAGPSLSTLKQLSKDTISTMMVEELLCKAVIYAAELEGVIKIITDDLGRSVNARGPLSHTTSAKSGCINIFINSKKMPIANSPSSPPYIAIIRNQSHYLIQFNGVTLRADQFNERLSACLAEPYIMLL